LFETVKGAWEDLFERRYGFWRGILDEVVADVGHAQWVFTVPKLLRPYFMHHRKLLGPLCTAAWQTVRELMAVAAGEEQGLRPGMVAVIASVQTFGDQRSLHPHVHALVTRGGWTTSGEWAPVPYVDPSSAEQLFRHKVIRLLQRAGLLDEDRTRLLLSWPHSGFSVHNFVTVPAGDGRALEALARYCLRNPVSLARLRWVTGSATATYQPRVGHDDEKAETVDALDLVARLLAHVPDPRRHLVHYYGAYSNVVRGKLKARSQAQQTEPLAPGPGADAPLPSGPTSPSLAALRHGWAQLIRRVYEIDPLVCPRCRGVMRVVASSPRVASSAVSSTTLAPRLAARPRTALRLPQPPRFPFHPDPA
jgi:hypothetical protein